MLCSLPSLTVRIRYFSGSRKHSLKEALQARLRVMSFAAALPSGAVVRTLITEFYPTAHEKNLETIQSPRISKSWRSQSQ